MTILTILTTFECSSERLVTHLQFSGTWGLMGTKHHAAMGIEVDESKSHNLQPVLPVPAQLGEIYFSRYNHV